MLGAVQVSKKHNPYKFVVPPGKTEQEVLSAIENAVRILTPSFVFGYFSLEDIQQEARRMGLEAMERYDNVRPMENFLYRHIYNRLINFQRDNWKRPEAPCDECHAGSYCDNSDGGQPCKKYRAWVKRNADKAGLMRPMDLDAAPSEAAHQNAATEEDVARDELLSRIDEDLPVELRSIYLQMRAGVPVPKARRRQVEDAIREILSEEEL